MRILAASFALLVFIGMAVLNLVATVRIITKAGYSSWWILVPLSPIVMAIITFTVFVNEVRTSLTGSVSSFDAWSITGLLILDFLCGLFAWVFFLVFAFAEWPIQRQLRMEKQGRPIPVWVQQQGIQGFVGMPKHEAQSLPSRAQEPGWYPIEGNQNDQAYWDGRSWTGRRHWNGASWSDVPPGES